jgi:putative endonuclease
MAEEDVSLLAALRTRLRPGQSGEDIAARHLEGKGLAIVARNYRCRGGELDLVARDADGTVVFVEVKERRTGTHGRGLEAVGPGKRKRLLRAAQHYASRHGLFEAALRFDVVSVDWDKDTPRVRWERGAFDSNG